MGMVEDWKARGTHLEIGGRRIFVLDVPAASEQAEPLLMLHGFPTSSFDWHLIIDELARDRRVVSWDWLGFGLSDKPGDIRYSLFDQATIAGHLAAQLGIERAAVVSHDMGDSIAAELYARSIEGTLPFEVTKRVLTNGSVYIEMAQLSAGQQMLLALPDEALPVEITPGYDTFGPSIQAIFGETPASDDELQAMWAFVSHGNGHTILPRTIRYIEERRVHEGRWISALRDHPSPITVVWGDRDPIAVYAMAERFVSERPGTPLVTLDGVGHFPMIEAPKRLYDAIAAALAG